MFVKRMKVVLLRGIIAFVFVFRAKFFLQKKTNLIWYIRLQNTTTLICFL